MNNRNRLSVVMVFLALVFSALMWFAADQFAKMYPPRKAPVQAPPPAAIQAPPANGVAAEQAVPAPQAEQPAVLSESMADRLERLKTDGTGWSAFRAAVIECAAADPVVVAEWAAKNLPPGGDRAFALKHALRRWTALDPNAALDWALTLEPGQGRECAIRNVFDMWAETDPGAAALRLAYVQDFETRKFAAAAIAERWVLVDEPSAIEWARRLSPAKGGTYALACIAQHISMTNRAAGQAMAEQMPIGSGQAKSARSMSALLAKEGNGKPADWIESAVPGGISPDPAFQVLVAHWAMTNPDDALVWASQLADREERDDAMATVIQAIAKRNPASAAKAVSSMSGGDEKVQTVSRIMMSWAQVDAPAAQEWASGLADPAEQQAAQKAQTEIQETAAVESGTPTETAEAVADSSDDAGEDTSETMPEESGSTNAPFKLTSEVLSLPWWDLASLVEQLPDGDLRNGLAHKAAVEWAKDGKDPVGAAAWIAEQLAEGVARDYATRVIVWDWTGVDRTAALEWAASRADTAERDYSQLSIVMALARSETLTVPAASGTVADLSIATNLLTGISASEAKRGATGNFASQWAKVDADSARKWAEGLTEEDGRTIALEAISRIESGK